MISNLLKTLQKKSTSSFATLYTWGSSTSSLGLSTNAQSVNTPQKVSGLPPNIKNVVLGVNHSAVLTDDGQLYTFGSGKFGALGHNDGEKNHITPKLVEFFSKNKLKVKQVALGENHTIALTTDGDVWSWGYGGRSLNYIFNLFFSSSGALGHGDCNHRYTPTPVAKLRNFPPIKYLSTGYRFTLAINEKNELFKWGRGEYGVFGDGNNKPQLLPVKSDFFEELKQADDQQFVKIKSANNYTMALMSDGNLYCWGSNENGQMGTKAEIGVEIYETANFPTPVVKEDFQNYKVLDFAVGEDITAVLLENNLVFWSGSKLAYKPEKMRLPKDIANIKQIAVCFRSVAVLTVNNEIYFFNKFIQHQKENIETGIKYTTNSIFNNEEILEIGGGYRNCFAITNA